MSVRQDYLERMIQNVAATLARVIRLRREGRDEDALELLADESLAITRMQGDVLHAISDEDLMIMLRSRGEVEGGLCFALAEVLREEGVIMQDNEDARGAASRLTKSLRLYGESLLLADTVERDWVAGLREALLRFPVARLPEPTLDIVLAGVIKAKAYDVADNILYELLADDGERDTHVDRADRVYRQILADTDYTLGLAGLNRDEVEEALAALDAGSKWL
jgi:hypothetical protein